MEKSQLEKELDEINKEPKEKFTAPEIKERRNCRVNVRLDKKTYQKLCEMKEITGKSFPTILRETLMQKPLSKPIFNIKEAQAIIREANRLGNNVNQIARRMNSGCFDGWYPEFKEFCKEHAELFKTVANYGRGKKS